VDIHQLRIFAAVAEVGNLTHAAERLHLSQPAASAQIKQLEEEFGLTLFDRRHSGLALTAVGETLLPEIRHLLATAAQIKARARSLRGRVAGTVKLAIVAMMPDRSLVRLQELTNLLVTRYPLLNIEVHHQSSRSIKTGVATGEFDAGLALGSRDIPDLSRFVLQEVPYRVIAPASWDKRLKSASLKELAKLPWISCAKGGTHHDMAMQLFEKLSCQPDKIVEGDGEQVIASLVMAGVGLGLMREDLAIEEQTAGNIVVIDKVRASTFLQIFYCTNRENDPTIQAILDVLRDLWPDAELSFPTIGPKTSQQPTDFAHSRARPTKRPRPSISSR
jgi:DNA-binding transcriptional LysR family regulator